MEICYTILRKKRENLENLEGKKRPHSGSSKDQLQQSFDTDRTTAWS